MKRIIGLVFALMIYANSIGIAQQATFIDEINQTLAAAKLFWGKLLPPEKNNYLSGGYMYVSYYMEKRGFWRDTTIVDTLINLEIKKRPDVINSREQQKTNDLFGSLIKAGVNAIAKGGKEYDTVEKKVPVQTLIKNYSPYIPFRYAAMRKKLHEGGLLRLNKEERREGYNAFLLTQNNRNRITGINEDYHLITKEDDQRMETSIRRSYSLQVIALDSIVKAKNQSALPTSPVFAWDVTLDMMDNGSDKIKRR